MATNKNLFFRLTKGLVNKDQVFLKSPETETFSYQQMISMSGQYANALIKTGAKKNDRVIVKSGKNIECIWLYLACLRVGAVYVAINPSYTPAETTFFVNDSEPYLYISEETSIEQELKNLLRAKKIITLTLKGSDKYSLDNIASNCASNFETCFSDSKDIAAILYTSGTTGRSKGAILTHENLFTNAKSLSSIWHFSSKDTLLHILPIYHTHGLFVAFNTAILSKAAILFMHTFDSAQVISNFQNATVLMGVPTHYFRLLKQKGLNKKSASQIRLFISGSAPLPAEVHKNFFKRTAHNILERYGMTETNMITSNPYNLRRKPGTVGFPLPGVKVRITNIKDRSSVGESVVGSIEVKGPNVFRGYWNMPEKAQTDFTSDGYFITGDLGFIDSDGYLTICGRNKDLIISGGLNVYPSEVEKEIDSLDGIVESAVIGVPHEDFGEGVTAVIVCEDQTQFNERDIKILLKRKLAGYKIPLKFFSREMLPKNPMGKVQKNVLRAELKAIFKMD